VGIISESHYGQMLSSLQRNASTILKTAKTDMFCTPTARAASMQSDLLYLVCRYESGKLAKRDQELLYKVKELLIQCFGIVNKRGNSISRREALQVHMDKLRSVEDAAFDVVKQSIYEVELAFGCHTEIFLLNRNGKTLSKCSRDTGFPMTSEVEKAGENRFVAAVARLARHGLILQSYRGRITVFDMTWKDVSQRSLLPLQDAAAMIEEIEGHGLCKEIATLAHKYVSEGVYVIPLMSHGELLQGVMVVWDINKLFHAVYRVAADTTAASAGGAANASAGHGTNNAIGGAISSRIGVGSRGGRVETAGAVTTTKRGPAKETTYLELHGPEEGVTQSIRLTAECLGAALLSARLGDFRDDVASFNFTSMVTAEDVMKLVFQHIVTAIPTIREVSVWAVDMREKAGGGGGGIATARGAAHDPNHQDKSNITGNNNNNKGKMHLGLKFDPKLIQHQLKAYAAAAKPTISSSFLAAGASISEASMRNAGGHAGGLGLIAAGSNSNLTGIHATLKSPIVAGSFDGEAVDQLLLEKVNIPLIHGKHLHNISTDLTSLTAQKRTATTTTTAATAATATATATKAHVGNSQSVGSGDTSNPNTTIIPDKTHWRVGIPEALYKHEDDIGSLVLPPSISHNQSLPSVSNTRDVISAGGITAIGVPPPPPLSDDSSIGRPLERSLSSISEDSGPAGINTMASLKLNRATGSTIDAGGAKTQTAATLRTGTGTNESAAENVKKLPRSLSSSLKAPAIAKEVDPSGVALLHSEILRCSKTQSLRSFRLCTHHGLVAVGLKRQSFRVFDRLFGAPEGAGTAKVRF
jgi:hypothetical protein